MGLFQLAKKNYFEPVNQRWCFLLFSLILSATVESPLKYVLLSMRDVLLTSRRILIKYSECSLMSNAFSFRAYLCNCCKMSCTFKYATCTLKFTAVSNV